MQEGVKGVPRSDDEFAQAAIGNREADEGAVWDCGSVRTCEVLGEAALLGGRYEDARKGHAGGHASIQRSDAQRTGGARKGFYSALESVLNSRRGRVWCFQLHLKQFVLISAPRPCMPLPPGGPRLVHEAGLGLTATG